MIEFADKDGNVRGTMTYSEDLLELRLKPCPHCGHPASFRQVDPTLDGEEHPLSGAEYIDCTNRLCGASTIAMFSTGDDCKPLLAERWNRRV